MRWRRDESNLPGSAGSSTNKKAVPALSAVAVIKLSI
jgi:hypothetical protein